MNKGETKKSQANVFYSRRWVWSYKGGSLTKIRQTYSKSIKNVRGDSTQTKAPTSPFQIGDSLRYTDDGQNEMVGMVDVNKNDTESIKYIIKFLRVNTMAATKEFFKSRNVTYIVSIKTSSEEYDLSGT